MKAFKICFAMTLLLLFTGCLATSYDAGLKRIEVLGALVGPVAALVVSVSLILPSQATTVSPALRSFWVYIHIILAFIGNASLTLAGLGGILYLIQERALKGRKFGFFYRRVCRLWSSWTPSTTGASP